MEIPNTALAHIFVCLQWISLNYSATEKAIFEQVTHCHLWTTVCLRFLRVAAQGRSLSLATVISDGASS